MSTNQAYFKEVRLFFARKFKRRRSQQVSLQTYCDRKPMPPGALFGQRFLAETWDAELEFDLLV